MQRAVAGFDWDEGNLAKCQRHGVSIGEVEALLAGDPAIAPDPRHSAQEDRFIAVGRNPQGRPIFVALTFRIKNGETLIRPVSARYMHKKEVQGYETKGSTTHHR